MDVYLFVMIIIYNKRNNKYQCYILTEKRKEYSNNINYEKSLFDLLKIIKEKKMQLFCYLFDNLVSAIR
jgi:hypothetical protein